MMVKKLILTVMKSKGKEAVPRRDDSKNHLRVKRLGNDLR